MVNDSRIELKEEKSTFTGQTLRELVSELDQRISHLLHPVFIRDINELISRIDYYEDNTLTRLVIRRDFTRFTGTGGVKLIGGFVTTYYNIDGSVDSITTISLNRAPTDENYILSSSHSRSSSEG